MTRVVEGREWGVTFNEYEVAVGDDENILELNNGWAIYKNIELCTFERLILGYVNYCAIKPLFKKMLIVHEVFKKTEKEETLPNSFSEFNIILIPKLDSHLPPGTGKNETKLDKDSISKRHSSKYLCLYMAVFSKGHQSYWIGVPPYPRVTSS